MIDEIEPNTPDNVDKEPTTPPASAEQAPVVLPTTTEPVIESAPTTPPAVNSTEPVATANAEPAAPLSESALAAQDEIKPLPKRKTLSIIIHDAGVLRAAYMQFVKGGGLFIPTKKTFVMGEDTNLVIRLLDDDEPYRVSGRVVWITPFGSPNNKAGGIGVEFMEDKNGEKLRSRIEILLGPYLKSTESTHTM